MLALRSVCCSSSSIDFKKTDFGAVVVYRCKFWIQGEPKNQFKVLSMVKQLQLQVWNNSSEIRLYSHL